MEVLREGYMILFSRRPPLSDQPLPMPSYSPSSIRGRALEKEFLDLLHKGAIEQAPQTSGFYSRLFVVQKDSGSWQPIIDLSTLNTFIVSQLGLQPEKNKLVFFGKKRFFSRKKHNLKKQAKILFFSFLSIYSHHIAS